jgi:amino acid transporter
VSQDALLSRFKRRVVGKPIPSHLAHHERLSRVTGLAVLSSDPLSSVAYATEEILRVLVVAGPAALALASPLAGIIALILAVVVFSYRQTVHAYPTGGGAYVVARENLGELPALTAAAALLIDYVLTVAVSVAAGVAALTSAFPHLHVNRVEVSLVLVALLMIGNLRGIRESGRLFASPTYMFLAATFAMIGIGGWQLLMGSAHVAAVPSSPGTLEPLTMLMLLTAFSNGCTAMTGVEAISNGVPAFRPPESRNAASTLVVMGVLAIAMFLGITLLAHAYHIGPAANETVVSQLARAVFGGGTFAYYAVQATTMLILVLAANTAYADFPRLASILARDRYLPRQFMNQGDRLAFSNGIIGLSLLASVLLIVFGGDTHALIPLYMIGVFVSFTLSQAGMVVRWRRLGGDGWKTSAAINGVGALVTFVVLVVVAVTKAREGAWIIMVLMPIHVMAFRSTRRHYDRVASQLAIDGWQPQAVPQNIVVLPISGVHRAVMSALHYAKSISPDVRAVYVGVDPAAIENVRNQWQRWGEGVPLVVLDSPYRSLMTPLLEHLAEVREAAPDSYLTVVLPEFVPARWWHHLFHNQRALLIKAALLFRPNTVVTSVPFHLKH